MSFRVIIFTPNFVIVQHSLKRSIGSSHTETHAVLHNLSSFPKHVHIFFTFTIPCVTIQLLHSLVRIVIIYIFFNRCTMRYGICILFTHQLMHFPLNLEKFQI